MHYHRRRPKLLRRSALPPIAIATVDFVFPSRNDYTGQMSTRQYARLVHEWLIVIGLQAEDCGTHFLRRTKALIIYKATGNLRAVQMLLGHAKIESAVR